MSGSVVWWPCSSRFNAPQRISSQNTITLPLPFEHDVPLPFAISFELGHDPQLPFPISRITFPLPVYPPRSRSWSRCRMLCRKVVTLPFDLPRVMGKVITFMLMERISFIPTVTLIFTHHRRRPPHIPITRVIHLSMFLP